MSRIHWGMSESTLWRLNRSFSVAGRGIASAVVRESRMQKKREGDLLFNGPRCCGTQPDCHDLAGITSRDLGPLYCDPGVP